MYKELAWFLALLLQTLFFNAIPYLIAVSIVVIARLKSKRWFNGSLSAQDAWWLLSPTTLALGMLLFAAFHTGFWRDPVNADNLFRFCALSSFVFPLSAYVIWQTRRMWFITVLLLLPQWWQLLLSYVVGYMAVTGRWI